MRDLLKFYRLSDVTFYDHINTLYQSIKPFLDKKKNLFLRSMAPLTLSTVGNNFSKRHFFEKKFLILEIGFDTSCKVTG